MAKVVKPVVKYVVKTEEALYRKGGMTTDNINRAKTYVSRANARYGVYDGSDTIVPVEVTLREMEQK